MMDYKLSNALKIANTLLSYAKTGYSVDWYGNIPKSGYMVSINNIGLKFDSISKINEHEMSAWINQEHIDFPNDYFGIYKDQTSGKIYVDISINIIDIDEAIKFGKEQEQKSIYDINNKNNIEL